MTSSRTVQPCIGVAKKDESRLRTHPHKSRLDSRIFRVRAVCVAGVRMARAGGETDVWSSCRSRGSAGRPVVPLSAPSPAREAREARQQSWGKRLLPHNVAEPGLNRGSGRRIGASRVFDLFFLNRFKGHATVQFCVKGAHTDVERGQPRLDPGGAGPARGSRPPPPL